MKLAVSNIAWPVAEEEAVADALRDCGVTGVEVAPRRTWPDPSAAPAAEVRAYREFWESRGLRVVAFQALLFGRPDLTLFEDAVRRRATLDYLKRVIALAGDLGAGALVFGSPRNRLRGALPDDELERVAVAAFRELGDAAAAHATCFCIEPNPPAYGCDYVTTAAEGLALVRRVDHPGFGLHLDAAALTLAGEDPEAVLREALPWVRHFHVSEPSLAPLGSGGTDHRKVAAALRAAGYEGWRSIEMRWDGTSPAAPGVCAAVAFAAAAYFAAGGGA